MSGTLTRCTSCNAPIFFATSSKDRPMPLDAVPSVDGKWFVSPGGLAVHFEDTGDFAQRCRAAREKKYTAHFATCPNADRHRKGSR